VTEGGSDYPESLSNPRVLRRLRHFRGSFRGNEQIAWGDGEHPCERFDVLSRRPSLSLLPTINRQLLNFQLRGERILAHSALEPEAGDVVADDARDVGHGQSDTSAMNSPIYALKDDYLTSFNVDDAHCHGRLR
jgi:hypothetical protein